MIRFIKYGQFLYNINHIKKISEITLRGPTKAYSFYVHFETYKIGYINKDKKVIEGKLAELLRFLKWDKVITTFDLSTDSL
jgi:hypothetical protein